MIGLTILSVLVAIFFTLLGANSDDEFSSQQLISIGTNFFLLSIIFLLVTLVFK